MPSFALKHTAPFKIGNDDVNTCTNIQMMAGCPFTTNRVNLTHVICGFKDWQFLLSSPNKLPVKYTCFTVVLLNSCMSVLVLVAYVQGITLNVHAGGSGV